ncbi:NADH-quinone oxidoreductase subunit B [Methanohalophilus portucalensis]|uniref:F420H2 dehydrogenase subunit B n=2 Tax=Methanohalophilus portucalensis TaxID=39664 RepID=A0A1L9C2Y6_9EURY|nr:NADH-quinone oxidoreductase subunit B [Methanohalophilus portucalensis]ATU07626.1 dehydrogenase [Methanohalophilus portucalensis]OJH48890.1 F420H2 dehydrogenase subunit B [Methanohalophilus portucalensis FDF-1]SMH37331.1 F420H2 dehydrogenase subunit B [Methanohalophilus portucalensis FDF-1]
MDEELKEKSYEQPVAKEQGAEEENIPGVVTTTSKEINKFLQKTKAQDFINWGRKNSLWFMAQAMGCCGVEIIVTGMSPMDTDRFGIIPRNSPRQADVMIISGYVTKKYLPALKKLYDQMPSPKWVICMGDCSISGGPFYESYSTVQNIDEIFPVDVFIPGCPPRPEALIQGFLEIQKKIEAREDKGSGYDR